ncbi:SDR family oxidoreductase [Parvularcula sp. ZS-1/3]|uniref:SDR family oxidoreductase n=1 Tax=Parvularcula mediterranea TaxID=2732508 RepID=A0A7Y3W4D0_9PROT|nr:SDR family oxidoreductase [Parvularcula mediterranea]NNU15096.1 SDR family oxidoreductase [Parvularcula mediterranea]
MTNPAELFSVKGKTAVITGGTRGIGLDMARALVANGAKVIISSRKDVAVEAAVEELAKHGDASGFAADLGTIEGAKALAEFVGSKTDKVDILINNAGATWGSTLEDFPEDGWDKIMNVNLKGPFFLTQQMLPFLKAAAEPNSPAKVINVASVEGMRAGQMETYSYGASKSALIHLTEHLALQLAGRNITVNAIAPGPFATKMMAGTIQMAGEDTIAAMVPLKRLGQSEDLYAMALYLGSGASNYVTGQTIALGGGLGTIA